MMPREVIDWMTDWVDGNPVGEGVGWHPYPLSRRIVNWIIWAGGGHHLPPVCRKNLAVQARFLERRVEHWLGGNHLLANAKALVAAGLFFDGPEAARWYRRGMKLMAQELDEQILTDGGHYERSASYHRIVLVDLLDLMALHEAAARESPARWTSIVDRMISWGSRMSYPDGAPILFNDANEDMAPDWASIVNYATGVGGIKRPPDPLGVGPFTVWDLEDTGYLRIEGPDCLLFVDLGPLGPAHLPAHGHADTLTFDLALGGEPIVVDTGVSTYETGEERAWERGTAAHNTVTVDGRDSSEMWRAFRVGRRANIVRRSWTRTSEEVEVLGAHDGYGHLGCLHVRAYTLAPGELRISDRVEGGKDRRLESHLHLHPNVDVARWAEDRCDLEGPEVSVRLFARRRTRVRVRESAYAPSFGVLRSRIHVILEPPPGGEVIEYALCWDRTAPDSPPRYDP